MKTLLSAIAFTLLAGTASASEFEAEPHPSAFGSGGTSGAPDCRGEIKPYACVAPNGTGSSGGSEGGDSSGESGGEGGGDGGTGGGTGPT
jgi:hypothetical protein